MSEFEKRLQILLDQARYERVTALARARGISVGAVIREAIDKGLGQQIDVQYAALDVIMNAEPGHIPDDPRELVAELYELRGQLA